jgi:hypothetical protein
MALIDCPAMLASAADRGNVHYELLDLHARVYGDFAYVRGLGVIRSDSGKPPVESL